MIRVNLTKFKKNFNHYMNLSLTEDVYITKYGRDVAVLSNSSINYYQTLTNLFGCLKDGDTGESYDDIIGKTIMERCGY